MSFCPQVFFLIAIVFIAAVGPGAHVLLPVGYEYCVCGCVADGVVVLGSFGMATRAPGFGGLH